MRWQIFAFYIHCHLCNLILYRKMMLKVNIGPIWADWPTPPFVQNCPLCRAPNTWVSQFLNWSILARSFKTPPQNGASNTWVGNFFHKTYSLFNFLCARNWTILGWLPDPPICPKMIHNMGPKIKELPFFSTNWPPFILDFVQ
jgi:hypothetical protein